jgi:hypothetical protein
MYLFTRRARLAPGRNRDSLEWALSITERARGIIEMPLSLHAQVLSPEWGTLVWSTFVPDLTSLEAATDKLTADDGYLSLADQGGDLTVGGVDDGLYQLVHGEPDPSRSTEYVSAVQTVCAPGSLARGMGLGVEIAQRAEQTTGVPTMFVADVTGTYAQVGWLTAYENIGQFEQAQQKLMSDQGWIELIDREVAGVFTSDPASSSQLLYRRLA